MRRNENTALQRYMDSHTGTPSDVSPSQIVVLPPRSRFQPTPSHRVAPTTQLQEVETPLVQEIEAHGDPPVPPPSCAEPVSAAAGGGGRPASAKAGARSRGGRGAGGRALSPPAQPPKEAFAPNAADAAAVPMGNGASSPRVPSRPAPTDPIPQQTTAAGVLVPRFRPASASVAAHSKTTNYVPRAYGKARPASARRPGSGGSQRSAGEGLDDFRRPDVVALWTPGETVLSGPALSGPGTALATPRRPQSEELQYELSVTASVLRAAQDRLTKEREARQLARVGEELAMVDVRRAREEMKALSEERRQEASALAKAMSEQRKVLEDELQRVETEQEVSARARAHTHLAQRAGGGAAPQRLTTAHHTAAFTRDVAARPTRARTRHDVHTAS